MTEHAPLVDVHVVKVLGKALWGEKWGNVLVGGSDEDKIEVMLCLRVPNFLFLDRSRFVPDRPHVFIIPEVGLTKHPDGHHYLSQQHIVKAYGLVQDEGPEDTAGANLTETPERSSGESRTNLNGWTESPTRALASRSPSPGAEPPMRSKEIRFFGLCVSRRALEA